MTTKFNLSNFLHKLHAILLPHPKEFWKIIAFILTYSFCVLWVDDHYFPKQKFLEAKEVMATTSIVIGILLVFRTNSAYERWWEGRKLWGELVNNIRNLAIKLKIYFKADAEQQKKIGQLLIAFPFALRDHLQEREPNAYLLKLTDGSYTHLPLQLANQIFQEISDLTKQSDKKEFELLLIDSHLRSFMDICGACERILKSPIAISYKWLIWVWLHLYLLILPWLLVPIFDYWSLPLMLVGTYFAIAIELLAEEVEEPFGTSPNDLPLTEICTSIETSVCHELGCSPPNFNHE